MNLGVPLSDITGDLSIINRVDAVFALPNWKRSPGANKEIAYAKDLSIPVFSRLTEIKQFLKNGKNTRFEESIQRLVNLQVKEINKNFIIVPRLSSKKQQKIR